MSAALLPLSPIAPGPRTRAGSTFAHAGGHAGRTSEADLRVWTARLEGLSCPPTLE